MHKFKVEEHVIVLDGQEAVVTKIIDEDKIMVRLLSAEGKPHGPSFTVLCSDVEVLAQGPS